MTAHITLCQVLSQSVVSLDSAMPSGLKTWAPAGTQTRQTLYANIRELSALGLTLTMIATHTCQCLCSWLIKVFSSLAPGWHLPVLVLLIDKSFLFIWRLGLPGPEYWWRWKNTWFGSAGRQPARQSTSRNKISMIALTAAVQVSAAAATVGCLSIAEMWLGHQFSWLQH